MLLRQVRDATHCMHACKLVAVASIKRCDEVNAICCVTIIILDYMRKWREKCVSRLDAREVRCRRSEEDQERASPE